MLYLTPENYVSIDNVKFIINLNETSSFNQELKKRIGENNFEINAVSDRRKRSLILLQDKKAILCNINTGTIFDRINNNEVKGLSKKFIDLSYNNYIPLNNILVIADYETQQIIEMVKELRKNKSVKLFNFTSTRKTKTVIFTINNDIILSAIESSTLYKRANETENIFQSIGLQNYINTNHIHLIADRDENHIKLKIKDLENIEPKKVLRLSKSEKPKSALFCTNNFIILSKLNTDTIAKNIGFG